jgi:3-methyladenine DNA glycosylase AlkD
MKRAAGSVAQILAELEKHGDPRNVEGMARYGIRPARAYGVPAPAIYRIARKIGRDHDLAADLWETGVHEARAVAALIDDPRLVDSRQMESWAAEFDSWAVCDHVCGKLFDRTPLAWPKALAWTRRRPEYVRRAGFALIAWLTVHDKKAPDDRFLAFLPLIERAASDERNMVKKAVNWALRQIGKRNARLNRDAIACADRVRRQGSPPARWIAADALRELRSPKVQARLARGVGDHT